MFSFENVHVLMRLGLRAHQKVTKSLNRLSKMPLREDFFNGCQLLLCGRAKAKGKRKNADFITSLILRTQLRRFIVPAL